jgi:hypothetical protein
LPPDDERAGFHVSGEDEITARKRPVSVLFIPRLAFGEILPSPSLPIIRDGKEK